ncbi:helix-turn-helix domain-containing protein [Spirillospora sp. CA-255316]
MSAVSPPPSAPDPHPGHPAGPLPEAAHERASERYRILLPHLHDEVPLARAAEDAEVTYRTLQRWAAAYRAGGLAGLARAGRSDKGRRKFPAAGRQPGRRPRLAGTGLPHRRRARPGTADTPARRPTRTSTTWSAAARPSTRTRSGRPTTPSWTSG